MVVMHFFYSFHVEENFHFYISSILDIITMFFHMRILILGEGKTGKKKFNFCVAAQVNFVLDSQTHYINHRLRNSPKFVPLVDILVLQHKPDFIDSLLFI